MMGATVIAFFSDMHASAIFQSVIAFCFVYCALEFPFFCVIIRIISAMKNSDSITSAVPPNTCTRNKMNINSRGGRGASVSACADLTNQLQCCWVYPACAWIKTLTQQL